MDENLAPNALIESTLDTRDSILVSEHAFKEIVATISDEPEQPSESLLNAVAMYKKHSPIVRQP